MVGVSDIRLIKGEACAGAVDPRLQKISQNPWNSWFGKRILYAS